MGNTQGQPQELVRFKKLPESESMNNVDIPEVEQNRYPTNSKWLIAFIMSFLIMLPFVIYTLVYADYRRFAGYDSCGNICGIKNAKVDGISCSGEDFTNFPYLLGPTCVADCGAGYRPLESFNVCVSSDSNTYGENESVNFFNFRGTEWKVAIAIIICLFIAVGMLFLFRHAVDMVVWGMIIAGILMYAVVVGICWWAYATTPNDSTNSSQENLLVWAIVLSVMGVVYLIMLVWLKRKIDLVIQLLKEATKAIFSMPGLIGVPVLALFVHIVISVMFVVLLFYMFSAGTLQANDDPVTQDRLRYTYQKNPVMIIALAYAIFMWFWICQVVVGVNYMITSGAVSKWYFSRNRDYLEAPIRTSARIAFRFHLGTAALGGFIIAVITLIKMIISSLIKNERVRSLFNSCSNSLEEFFKFLSKNAYIITAMHGQPFIKSGKRAARLIFYNLKSIIAINWIGDFVLGMAQFLIILVTLLIFALMLYISPATNSPDFPFFPYIVVGVFAILTAGVTFGVFETTIDTLFVCYCEDSMMNDGMARPYYMSRELMEFIDGSKKMYVKV